MGQHLPHADLPSGRGLIPASDDEILRDVIARNPPGGPWAAAYAFNAALAHEDGARLDELQGMVTPESLAGWGDFTAARDLLSGTCMTSRADQPAPGAAYVKFVSDPGQGLISDGTTMIMARAIVTLQFRPETGQWKVHALGDYCRPEQLPPLP
jgi:hypothetical protein